MNRIERETGWAWMPDALDATSCARLRAAFDTAEAHEGGLVGGQASAVRRSRIIRFDDDGELAWAYDALLRLVAAFNREAFEFRLDGFDEQLQLARYEATDLGFYDWHIDRGGNGLAARRKLSLTIQLDAPDAYAGGGLVLNATGTPVEAPRAQGTAVAFPSFMPHRVAPVTAGTRHALVGWVAGPAFT